jgi:multisubunit Na+/H+ antiporter MnhF subunit
MAKFMKTFFTAYNKWFLVLLDSAIIFLVLFVVLSAVAYDKVAGLDILFVAVIWAVATPSLLILEIATRRAVKVDVVNALHVAGKRDVGLDAGH